MEAIEKNSAAAQKDKRLWQIAAAAIVLVRGLVYAGIEWCAIFPDTGAYREYNFLHFLQGCAENNRVPVYPLLIDGFEAVFGEGNFLPLVLLQMVLSALSLVLLAQVLQRIGVRSPWAQLCVFLYASTTATAGWDVCLLTESLTLTGVVCFFWLVTAYLQTHRRRNLLLCVALIFLLVFMRPQYQIFWAILIVFCLLRYAFPDDIAERRGLLQALAALALVGVAVLAYCAQYQRQFGVFTMSDAKIKQDLCTCVQRGYYVEFEDEELRDVLIEETVDKGIWAVVFRGMEFGDVRVKAATDSYIRQHLARYLLDTLHVMKVDCHNVFEGYAQPVESAPARALNPILRAIFDRVYVFYAFVASAASGIVMAVQWVRRRKIPWLWAAFFSTTCSMVVTTYFATCGEYMRTMLGILPGLYMMGAMLLQTVADACRKRCAARKEKPQ